MDQLQKKISMKQHYDRCSNPFSLENHHRRKDLRYPSENLLKKKLSLRRSDLLCTECRKKIATVDERNIQILEPGPVSHEDLSPLCSQSSNLSLETKLPVLNEALTLMGHSPVSKKKLKISGIKWIENKAAAVGDTVKESLGPLAGTSGSDNGAWDTSKTIDQLKKKFHSPDTNRNLKMQILTLLPENWSIAQIARKMDTTLYMARAGKRLFQEKGILSAPDGRLGNSLSNNLKSKIIEFYEEDAMSALMPGMKDYVSVRNDDGKRIHRQKRLILCNLKELYQQFKKRCPELKVGFSMFASLRPKHCVLAGSSGTHTVCVCSMHQNMKLMIQGCNLPSLTKDLEHHLSTYEDCLNLLICSDSSPGCYLGTCKKCPGHEALQEILLAVFEDIDIENIKYKQWVSKPRTSLETFTKCAVDFAADFCDQAKILLQHSFIATKQANFIKELKNSLQIGECLVMCDFAENYAFIVQNAAPGFHWNNRQATLYPVVVYYKAGEIIEHKSLIIISDCLNHDSIAVYVFSGIINQFIKSIVDNLSRVYYCSDGAPQQFKNYKNFANIYHHQQDFGIPAEWHFSATAHGKGPCDGIGGTVKRMAARASLQLPADRQITTPRELYEWAHQPENIPSIAVHYTNVSEYENAKDILTQRFENAKSIPQTQKLHCLIPAMDGTVTTKRYSAAVEFNKHPILKNYHP